MQLKPEEVKYFKWIEPALIVRKSINDQTTYILYNRISNFKIDNDNFKIVIIDIPKYKSQYTDYINNYRDEYVKYLQNLHPENYKLDAGFSAMIDAIRSKNEDLVMIYKNFSLIGAASYDIINKKKNINVNHIGVMERQHGHGTLLMREIFSLAKILEYSVTATSNGYADDFYHSLNMIRIADKPLGIYTIKPEYIGA
ncbi:MAG: hypothetical protein MUO21_09760 [Nitrososphaeraceae archaeon]|nr:hypothetical protein [Nitrososphaeraceae archaeon]